MANEQAEKSAPKCYVGMRHSWTAEGMGGCKENPGVWSLGGTTLRFSRRCVHCGLERHVTTYGAQGRNPSERKDLVEYVRPAAESLEDF